MKDDVVIVAVGSDTPGKRELGDEVMEAALEGGNVVGDTRENVFKLGECQWIRGKGGREKVVTLGDVVMGKVKLREGGIKVVDLTGAGAQDAAVAGKVMEKILGK